jgi:hypothetical protein
MGSKFVDRNRFAKIVNKFYPNKVNHRAFFVNSNDGYTIGVPTGLFMPVGITSSITTIQGIADEVTNIMGVKATVAELTSRVINGEYVNQLTGELETTGITQYNPCSEFINDRVIPFDGLDELCDHYIDEMMNNSRSKSDIINYADKITKVEKMKKKIESAPKDDEDYEPSTHSICIVDNGINEFALRIIDNKVNSVQKVEKYNGSDVITYKRIGVLVKFWYD